MEFRILGPIEVSDEGQRIEIGGHKQRALLAFLAEFEATRAGEPSPSYSAAYGAQAAEMAAAPQSRAAQKALADDVTGRLHGEGGLASAQRATRALFGGEVDGLGAAEIADIFADVPSSDVPSDQLGGAGKPLLELLVEAGVASSKGEARRSIEGGGVYVNGVRVTDVGSAVHLDQAVEGRFLLLRIGKKRYHLVAVRR
jgi:tyrosyl-tRNA synthetase